MKTILVVLGTRPEAIKLAPVILELKKYPDIYQVLICNTEQQKELSSQTLSFFGIKADLNLNVMSPNQTLAGVQGQLLQKLAEVYINHKIDATIVQGDTMTVFCGALVSFYNKIPVFHVEAGLRSYHMLEPFPEEAIRQMTTRIATVHFAPTEEAKQALLKEAVSADRIVVTGNTVIDALHSLSEDTLKNAEQGLAEKGIYLDKKYILITAHRRENHGKRLENILFSIMELAQRFTDHQFVFSVHPNPNVKDKVYEILGQQTNIILTKPLDYPELIVLMKNATLVLTDSGGIQEEAPSFGVPVLVMRNETERREGINEGFSKLVGASKKRIRSEVTAVLAKEKSATRLDGQRNPYGDGCAAKKIKECIDRQFC